MVSKDLFYCVAHYTWKFDPNYLIVMTRFFSRDGENCCFARKEQINIEMMACLAEQRVDLVGDEEQGESEQTGKVSIMGKSMTQSSGQQARKTRPGDLPPTIAYATAGTRSQGASLLRQGTGSATLRGRRTEPQDSKKLSKETNASGKRSKETLGDEKSIAQDRAGP